GKPEHSKLELSLAAEACTRWKSAVATAGVSPVTCVTTTRSVVQSVLERESSGKPEHSKLELSLAAEACTRWKSAVATAGVSPVTCVTPTRSVVPPVLESASSGKPEHSKLELSLAAGALHQMEIRSCHGGCFAGDLRYHDAE